MSYITQPGIYYDMPSEIYHSDPCPQPSLSASGINELVYGAPAKFWYNNPRLNPDYPGREESTTFDIGTAAHLIFLEPDKFASMTCVIYADDYKSKAAREERDAARLSGKTPLLAKQADAIRSMHLALMCHPIARDAFKNGNPEVSCFWRDREFGTWGRCRPDWVPDNGKWLVDYKTASSANPSDFAQAADRMRYYQRAAWYIDGWAQANGKAPEHYWFVVQEKTPPYLVSVIELDCFAIDAGRDECRQAVTTFARCLSNGSHKDAWPGYRHPKKLDQDATFQVGLPAWAHNRVTDKVGEFDPKPASSAVRRMVEKSQFSEE